MGSTHQEKKERDNKNKLQREFQIKKIRSKLGQIKKDNIWQNHTTQTISEWRDIPPLWTVLGEAFWGIHENITFGMPGYGHRSLGWSRMGCIFWWVSDTHCCLQSGHRSPRIGHYGFKTTVTKWRCGSTDKASRLLPINISIRWWVQHTGQIFGHAGQGRHTTRIGPRTRSRNGTQHEQQKNKHRFCAHLEWLCHCHPTTCRRLTGNLPCGSTRKWVTSGTRRITSRTPSTPIWGTETDCEEVHQTWRDHEHCWECHPGQATIVGSRVTA